MSDSKVKFETRTQADSRVVTIVMPESLDLQVSEDLRAELSALVNQGFVYLVVDLSNTAYVDSSGLGALVSRIAEIRSKGGDLRLASPSQNVANILNLTHLNRIITSYADLPSAVDSFSDSMD